MNPRSSFLALHMLISSGVLFSAPLSFPFLETLFVISLTAGLDCVACIYVYSRSYQSSGILLSLMGTVIAFVACLTMIAAHGIDCERRKLFLHERKLVRKLSSFRHLMNKKDLAHQLSGMHMGGNADQQEKMLNEHLTAEVRERLDDWGILPTAVQFDERLGAGAFGVVYKGFYRQREIAIKTMSRDNIDEKNLERFTSEIFLLARLHHPNIIGFVGTVLEVDNMYILLEYASR